ncbi:MAG: TetR/AcrR family transcriptional regulator [Blastomonas sp.]
MASRAGKITDGQPGISTRERLLRSAISLIWRHGYNAVSVDAICADAGAHKGSFYHAYPSKAAILSKAIDRIWERDRAELAAIAEGPGTALQRLERHMDWFLENQQRLLSEQGYVPGHFHLAIDIQVPDAARIAAANRDEHHKLLQSAIRASLLEEGADDAFADFLTMAIERIISGVMIEARLGNSLAPLQDLTALAMKLRQLALSAKSDPSFAARPF